MAKVHRATVLPVSGSSTDGLTQPSALTSPALESTLASTPSQAHPQFPGVNPGDFLRQMDHLPFDEQVRTAAARFCQALASVLAALGADPHKPQHISRQLKLDKSLAWKVSRIVLDPDPISAIARFPGKSGLKILVESLEKANAPAGILAEFKESIAAFEHIEKVHAGSRETLQIMLADSPTRGTREREEAHRKLAFQGNSTVFGVQARVQLSIHFVAPHHADPSLLDLSLVCGLIDFRRLRQDVPWTVASARLNHDDGTPFSVCDFSPMDPSIGPGEVPAMREFCSPTLPPLRAVRQPNGRTRFEIGEGPVGNTAAATYIAGWITRAAVSPYAALNNQYGESQVIVATPSETLFHDFYVHKSMTYAMDPVVRIYNLLPGQPVYPSEGRDRGILPLEIDMIRMGFGAEHASTPEVPNYMQLVETSTSRIGYPLKDFYAFRLKLKYPPIPCLVLYRHLLPERPT